MTKKQNKGRYHPSRISGHQKFLRAKEANEKVKIERKLDKIDITKQDWSLV